MVVRLGDYIHPKITSIKIGEKMSMPSHKDVEGDVIIKKSDCYWNLGVPLMKKLEVKVTEQHIQDGIPKDVCHCPIALALREAYEAIMPEGTVVMALVDNYEATVKFADSLRDMENLDFTNQKDFAISKKLHNWILNYDNETFEEDMPTIEFVSIEDDDYEGSYLIEALEYTDAVENDVTFWWSEIEGIEN